MFRAIKMSDFMSFSLTEDEREAMPIITVKHKQRCPYCNSPKCLHNSPDTPRSHTGFSLGDKKEIIVRFYQCLKTSKYFFKEYIGITYDSEIKSCITCGSKKIDIEKKYEVLRGNVSQYHKQQVKNAKWKPNRIVTVVRCNHCKFYCLSNYNVDEKYATIEELENGHKDVEEIINTYFDSKDKVRQII